MINLRDLKKLWIDLLDGKLLFHSLFSFLFIFSNSFFSILRLDRCIKAHIRPKEQNLFAIIQGGLDFSAGGLRERCLKQMIERDTPGYAIGGLAGGESKDHFWRVVAHVRLLYFYLIFYFKLFYNILLHHRIVCIFQRISQDISWVSVIHLISLFVSA